MTHISFSRLSEIDPHEIASHMSDPVLAKHMPLLEGPWDTRRTENFVAMKEARWVKDGLGHWAFLAEGRYVGWGGFQLEENDWDFGLVLKPTAFGLGIPITQKALEFARADKRITSVTFLFPPTRSKLAALARLGAVFECDMTLDGALFRKFRLNTDRTDQRHKGA